MNVWEAIRKASHDSGISLSVASRILGRNDSYVSDAFGRGKCPSFDRFKQIAEAFGYSVCLVKQGSEPDDAIVVDETRDDSKRSTQAINAAAKKERERKIAMLQAELDRLGDIK